MCMSMSIVVLVVVHSVCKFAKRPKPCSAESERDNSKIDRRHIRDRTGTVHPNGKFIKHVTVNVFIRYSNSQ